MKFKEAIQKASVEVMLAQAEAIPKAQEMANRKWVRITSKVLIVGLLLGTMAIPAFAAESGGGDIFAKGEDLANDLITQIRTISTVLAGLCLAVSLLLWMFSSSSKAVDAAKSWIVRILVAYAAIMAAPVVIETIKRLASS